MDDIFLIAVFLNTYITSVESLNVQKQLFFELSALEKGGLVGPPMS